LLPSGQSTVTQNRVAWARTYLSKAGLVLPTRRGYVRVTDEGRQLLGQPPDQITVKYLREKYPAIKDFISGSGSSDDSEKPVTPHSNEASQTPEEMLEDAYQRLRQELADEILSQVKEMSSQAFERLVIELLVKMGYGGTLKDAKKTVSDSIRSTFRQSGTPTRQSGDQPSKRSSERCKASGLAKASLSPRRVSQHRRSNMRETLTPRLY